MIEAVVFDMDGVLTDSEPVINEAAIRGLREYGVYAEPEDFIPFVGAGEDRYIGGVAEKYGQPYDVSMKKRVYEIYLDILPTMLRPFTGVTEFLKELAGRNVTMAVASSADRVKVTANLRAIGVEFRWFGAIITGEDVEQKKPAPDIYLHTARVLGLAPDRCCVVEDAINGIEAARAAGMRCVAVAQSFTVAELQEACPDVIRQCTTDISLDDLFPGKT